MRALMVMAVSALSLTAAGESVVYGPVENGLRISASPASGSSTPVIALHVENTGDSSRALTVGTSVNSQDRWNVTATLLSRDGISHRLILLPSRIVVTGNIEPVTIDAHPHVPHRIEIPMDRFEIDGSGGTKLATRLGSGDRLLIRLHCGPLPHRQAGQDLWIGDLTSGWLTL